MIQDLYNIFAIWFSSGIFLMGGLFILFNDIPESPLLGNYRRAQYMMAGAYFFFVVVTIAEGIFLVEAEANIHVLQAITLIIAISQAFLFTWALRALLTVEFSGWQYIFKKSMPVIAFIVAVAGVYIFAPKSWLNVAFYGFALVYGLLLIFYARLFFAAYKRYKEKMDNFYADLQAEQMRWVKFSFLAALAIGVFALATVVFPSIELTLIFAVAFNAFYAYFAIRFVNYPNLFKITLEPAMCDYCNGSDDDDETPKSAVFVILEKKIEQWVAEKKFTEKGVTITKLSELLDTNRNYLSSYINKSQNKTFNQWIAELRVNEAKNLIRQHTDLNIKEIAEMTGYANAGHFILQFTKLTGISPNAWKKQN